jgi:SAM-dependent methyltransferase
MKYGQLCTEFYDEDKKFSSDDELKLYRSLFEKGDLLLEPMCGSGRLLIPLMQSGFCVEGIDNSSSMLQSCRERAIESNLSPTLYECDFEHFSANKKYNGIVIPFGSFQLFYPRENACRALERFHTLLLRNGKLVMDLFIPWEALYEHGDIDNSTRHVTLASGDIIEISSETTVNKFEQHLLSKSKYIKYRGNKMIAEELEQMDILWYYPFEIELLLEKYGFNNIKCINRFLNGGDHMTFVCEIK